MAEGVVASLQVRKPGGKHLSECHQKSTLNDRCFYLLKNEFFFKLIELSYEIYIQHKFR